MKQIAGIAATVVFVLSLMSACCSIAPMSPQEAAEVQLKAADTLGIPVEKTLPRSGIVLRLIPAGAVRMGDPDIANAWPDNEILQETRLTKPFYLGEYEVTQEQWRKVMGSNPAHFKEAGVNAPVECVSWHDCTNFMAKLAELEDMSERSFRLPTEAEWEYACRAGTQTKYCYGHYLDSGMANFAGAYLSGEEQVGEFREKTMPAGQFKPNAWGLYDMHGNVSEWCADWYGDYERCATDPRGAASGSYRVIRGGSWKSIAEHCGSAYRYGCNPDQVSDRIGFRLSMTAGR